VKGAEKIDAEREKTQFELPRGFAGRILLMSMNLGHKTIYKSVAKALELQAEDSLLEIACGNGHFIKNYASHVHSVAGLDFSELCIKLATKKNKKRIVARSAEFVLGEATQLPWEDNKFSVATSMSSFLLFTKPVALESLKEIYRVLRLGGRVVVSIELNAEDGKDHSKDIKRYGMKLWTEDDVQNTLKEAGFSEIVITYVKGFMMPKMMIARGLKQ
jgi:ubiquinone/menaquinone biosynthesis C-methylase UbiE